jgi:hypothetical protein
MKNVVCIMICVLGVAVDMQALFVNRWNRRQEMAGKKGGQPVTMQSEALATPDSALAPSAPEQPEVRGTISRVIIAPSDVTRLQRKFARALKEQGEEQVAAVSKKSGKKFVPSERFIQDQARARTQLLEQVIPQVTSTVTLSRDAADIDAASPKFAAVIDVAAIAALSPQEMRSVMEALFQGLRVLPPIPTQATEWSEALVPLFSFSAQTQRELGALLQSWVTAFLKNPADVKSLAAAAKLPEEQRAAKINSLRKKYSDLQHNASQFLYAWIQIASILNANGPLTLFLQYATRDAGNLKNQFESLIKMARTELAVTHQKKVSAQDATGFVLLMIQTLFAPNGLASLMEEQDASEKGARA